MKAQVLAALIASASAYTEMTEVDYGFMQYVVQHGKSYATKEEFETRKALFAEADAEIKELNNSGLSATFGHNFLSDWTNEEKAQLLGYNGPQELVEGNHTELPKSDQLEVDWISAGAVNAVKNQGSCGSCWAFSAISSIEGHHFIQSGELLSLAEQQLVDCDTTCAGCNGGWQSYAMEYAESNPIQLESEYSYTAQTGTCTSSQRTGDVYVTSVQEVEAKSVQALKDAIAQGPVSVTVEADRRVFQHYTSGVLDSWFCGTSLDHAITAVGYGTEDGKDYYLVRNSWGSSWGDQGYIKIAATSDGKGVCGIQQVSVWPLTN